MERDDERDETEAERLSREQREELDNEEPVNGPDDATATGTPSDGAAANDGSPVPRVGETIDPASVPPAERPEQAGNVAPELDNVRELERDEAGNLVNDTEEEQAARAGLHEGELKNDSPANG